MLSSKFGVEIEFTGITREQAARTVRECIGGTVQREYGAYDTYMVTAPDGRGWKLVSDSSIKCQKRGGNGKLEATTDKTYSVELVTPILTYREDIDTLQKIVRALRQAGGESPRGAGIHFHLDGAQHGVRSILNFINIIASKNDLLYDALEIQPERMFYCKKLDAELVARINLRKPKTLEQIADVWYAGVEGSRNSHYNASRYHLLNLHSFFTGNHTIELRAFNGTLHAGKIRAYLILALALNHQALSQRSASPRKVQQQNAKFAMRTYLNRIGLIGKEFSNCRKHLTKALKGSAAWRFRAA
ncbi:hypothetical protein FACS1894184_09450 [Clostridia bacterium]|nr:hypothetical protein FACS1894184_09450 [Clostridia bacterium]